MASVEDGAFVEHHAGGAINPSTLVHRSFRAWFDPKDLDDEDLS